MHFLSIHKRHNRNRPLFITVIVTVINTFKINKLKFIPVTAITVIISSNSLDDQ